MLACVGYDMVLLKNGQWVPDNHRIPQADIKLRYDSKKHTVISYPSDDETHFISTLRVADNVYLSEEEKRQLFIHQKNRPPVFALRPSDVDFIV